jgi:hypothetical protein
MVEVVCDNCGKKILKNIKNGAKHYFCDKKCNREFIYKETHEIRICPICLSEFLALKKTGQTYCSLNCQIEWQRKFPRTGKNHPSYNHEIDHTVNCEWCGKDFEAGAYKITHGVRFCSLACRQEWYAKEWSQSNEWKQNRRKGAISQLENGSFTKNISKTQIVINALLEKINLKYQNEKSFGNFCVDIFLNDYNLIIEVMGDYFHCDIRKYKEISYSNQVDRIKRDKAKHTYIKKYYNIEVLYLWEKDINENILLCEKLIDEYINNGGILENYHSINYFLDNYNNLSVIRNILIPYMEWDIKKLNKVINIKTKEKMSHKQIDKWIIYNCEYCGSEKEELISHYKKSKHHFCSYKCASDFRKNNNWNTRMPLLSNNTIETSLND